MIPLWDAFLSEQRGRFVLFLPVFMAAGIAGYFALPAEPSAAWSAAAVAPCVGLCAVVWRRPVIRAAAFCLAFGCAGFWLAGLATLRAPPWPVLPSHAVVVDGVVSLVETLPEGRRVLVAAPSLDGEGALARALRIRLRRGDEVVVAAGDAIRVRALVRAPQPPDYPGGRDTQREAFFAGLAGYGFAIGPAEVRHVAGAGWWALFRERVAQRIMTGLPGSRGAIAADLLTGMGTAIPADDRTAFQDSGLAHLLAVAGLHIGIVMGLVFGATRLGLAAWEHAALHWPTRRIAAVAALAAGGLYLALTGAHVPILRSFAMAALVTLGVLTGRRAISLRGLAVAALVLMLIAPSSVMGVSFQMSFASVLTLIAGYEIVRPSLAQWGEGAWWRGMALYVTGLVLTSLLAGTASLPFAIYHFGRATLYYVPANMLAVPLTALWVMPWGLACLALMPFGLERMALVPMGWGIAGLESIAHGVTDWPASNLPVPQMPASVLVLFAVGLAWGGLWRGRLRLLAIVPVAASLVAAMAARRPDILVGPEARLIALRVDGRIEVDLAKGTSAFEMAAPGRVWGGGGMAAVQGCAPESCRMAVAGWPVLLARDEAGVSCGARLILSPVRLHQPCPGAMVIDRGFVTRNGATTLRIAGDALVVETDRGDRGNRPWVVLGRSLLPMARSE